MISLEIFRDDPIKYRRPDTLSELNSRSSDRLTSKVQPRSLKGQLQLSEGYTCYYFEIVIIVIMEHSINCLDCVEC